MKTIEEKRAISIISVGLILVVVVGFCSLFLGRYSISPGEVIEILINKILGISQKSMATNVVWNIRLPRLLMNIIVGAGLACSGAAFQGIFQNRLVSPDILGVSNGAGFGACLAMLLGKGIPLGITGMAFLGGMISVFLTYTISKMKKDNSTLSLVLSGIVVASFFSALISLVKLVADTDSVLPSITYWLMGSFASATFKKVLFAGVPVVIGVLILLLMRWKVNVLSMGDDEAYTLGINPAKNRLIIIIAATFITAACVTVTGIIGWIGMVMPNICREYVSADNKILLPASCVLGALFMIVVDLIARGISAAEIPIGILTAIVGAPIFVLICFKKEGGLQ